MFDPARTIPSERLVSGKLRRQICYRDEGQMTTGEKLDGAFSSPSTMNKSLSR